MMCTDPAKRLTMAGVLEHPWLADDLENTERVKQIMYPSTVSSIPATIKTTKRSACDDASSTEAKRRVSTDEKPSESTYSSGRPKRVKH
jgi:hypothetical protein